MQRETARLIVIGVSLVGGSAYLVSQFILTEVGALTLSTIRFLIGGILLLFFARLTAQSFSLALIRDALGPGIALAAAMSCVLIGVKNSLSTVAAFLVCSDAFMIPIVDWLLYRRRATSTTIFCLFLGFCGLAFLTIKEGLVISIADTWLVASAAAFAVYCSLIGTVVIKHSPISVSCVAHLCAGVIILPLALLLEEFPSEVSSPVLLGIAYYIIIISAVRFTLAAQAQQVLTPSEMGLIYLIEPVSAAFFGVVLVGERLTQMQWIGASLILFGVALPSIKRGRYSLLRNRI